MTERRMPDLTPDPEVMRTLRESRADQPPSFVNGTSPPLVPTPSVEPVVVTDDPVVVTLVAERPPLTVRIGIAQVAPMLDEQARRLLEAWVRDYMAAGVHASTALYAIELLRARIVHKELKRFGAPEPRE